MIKYNEMTQEMEFTSLATERRRRQQQEDDADGSLPAYPRGRGLSALTRPATPLKPDLVLPAVLVNRCPICGHLVRFFFKLEGRSHQVDLTLYDANPTWTTIREGGHQGAVPALWRECECDAEIFPFFSLDASAKAWLKKRKREPEPAAVASMVAALSARDLPALRVMRDEVTGRPMGLVYSSKVLEGGGYRYRHERLCPRCYNQAWDWQYNQSCRVCGTPAGEFIVSEGETYETYQGRAKAAMCSLWRTLGLQDQDDYVPASKSGPADLTNEPDGFFDIAREDEAEVNLNESDEETDVVDVGTEDPVASMWGEER